MLWTTRYFIIEGIYHAFFYHYIITTVDIILVIPLQYLAGTSPHVPSPSSDSLQLQLSSPQRMYVWMHEVSCREGMVVGEGRCACYIHLLGTKLRAGS